jgi:hypothetical protein
MATDGNIRGNRGRVISSLLVGFSLCCAAVFISVRTNGESAALFQSLQTNGQYRQAVQSFATEESNLFGSQGAESVEGFARTAVTRRKMVWPAARRDNSVASAHAAGSIIWPTSGARDVNVRYLAVGPDRCFSGATSAHSKFASGLQTSSLGEQISWPSPGSAPSRASAPTRRDIAREIVATLNSQSPIYRDSDSGRGRDPSPVAVPTWPAAASADQQGPVILPASIVTGMPEAMQPHRAVWRLAAQPGGGGGGLQLYERSTDDGVVCGLACGNATRCVAACRRERARLHGWTGEEPTEDEATCTRACGPLAPHCVRSCVAQRAAVHGWAAPVPTEDEVVCTRDCGPYEPHCVHACVRKRSRIHGWAGDEPTPDEAACTRACGPYAPHCVHACVAARVAAAGSSSERPVTAAAAAAGDDVCGRACGDSHACAVACHKARAGAAPSSDEAVCARACGHSQSCHNACMRRRAPDGGATVLPAALPAGTPYPSCPP